MSEPTAPRINPWSIWIPIIIIVSGVVILYNYLVMQAMQKDKDRPPYFTRLEAVCRVSRHHQGQLVVREWT